jgi:hypothetical protein
MLAHYGYRADGVFLFYLSMRTTQLSSKKILIYGQACPASCQEKKNISRYQFSKITGNCTFQRRK